MEKNALVEEQEGVISYRELEHLPAPVSKWLIRSGVVGSRHVHSCILRQKSIMKMSEENRTWYDASSEQIFNADAPSFIWKVKMKLSALMTVRGTDILEEGRGKMRISLCSVFNLVNETGPKISQGSLQRYLGEIVWFPGAALKPYIRWEYIDEYSARAVIESKGTRGEGVFYFDENGDFVKFSALRYKGNQEDARLYEWFVEACEYNDFEGIRVPVKLAATWRLEERNWTWLIMEIKEIRYNQAG